MASVGHHAHPEGERSSLRLNCNPLPVYLSLVTGTTACSSLYLHVLGDLCNLLPGILMHSLGLLYGG